MYVSFLQKKEFLWNLNIIQWVFEFYWSTFLQPNIGIIVSVRQWPGRSGFNPRSSHTKGSKNGT